MLFSSADPPSSGYGLNLGNADLQPPEFHSITPEEYLGYLRAQYKRSPERFVELAKHANEDQVTLYSVDRPDLVAVLYHAIVNTAKRHGWEIAGGRLPPGPKRLNSLYAETER